MNNETQVQIQNKFCLTIDEAVIYPGLFTA